MLRWLTGETDEIPVDDDNRGRLIGARDNYARTDTEIRQVRDDARRGLDTFDLPDPIDPADAVDPWRWSPEWMNAAWLRGVRDLLDWVLGARPTAPLSGRAMTPPTAYDLTHEESIADDIVLQGRPGGLTTDPATHPPPQYGEAIHATARWLRGETTTEPVDQHSNGTYARPAPARTLEAERHSPS